MKSVATQQIQQEASSVRKHGLARLDVTKPNVVRRLCHQAYISARRYARELNRYTETLTSLVFESRPPSPRIGHVDLVLVDAVRQGVLTAKQAEIIGATRLDGQQLTDYAKTHRITRSAADHRRRQAERRLVQWLRLEVGFNDIRLVNAQSKARANKRKSDLRRYSQEESI